jgi:uncharacterized protein YecT (DUF1311 family)
MNLIKTEQFGFRRDIIMLKNKRIFYFVMVIFLILYSNKLPAQTQSEMNNEANQDYRKTDNELNSVYKNINEIYKEDTLFIRKLKIAQKAWIVFRDAHMNSLYPMAENSPQEYGSIFPMCFSSEFEKITKVRIKELKVWLVGYDDLESCAGSVKSKHELVKIKNSKKAK